MLSAWFQSRGLTSWTTIKEPFSSVQQTKNPYDMLNSLEHSHVENRLIYCEHDFVEVKRIQGQRYRYEDYAIS